MTAILAGLIFIVVGIWGTIHYFPAFIVVVKGFVPISLFLGGMVSLLVGVSSLRPRGTRDKKKE